MQQKLDLEVQVDKNTRESSRLSKMKQKLVAELDTTKKQITKVQTSKLEVEIASTKVEKQVQGIHYPILLQFLLLCILYVVCAYK